MDKTKLNLMALAIAIVVGMLTFFLIKRKSWEKVYDTTGRVRKD